MISALAILAAAALSAGPATGSELLLSPAHGRPASGGSCLQPVSSGRFDLKFDRLELDQALRQVADMTGWRWVIPARAKLKITVAPAEKLTAAEVVAGVRAALEAGGYKVESVGLVCRVTQSGAGGPESVKVVRRDGSWVVEK